MGQVLPPPPLPRFIGRELPFARAQVVLEEGEDAGRRVHLIDHGRGRVVYLQHGNPTWCFLWRKVIARLDPARFRCVAPDLLGFGGSSVLRRPGDHRLERHLAALREVVGTLDLRDAILVGQDWGGPMVAGLGALEPGRVAGLVLANTSILAPARPRGTLFHRLSHLPVVSELLFRGGGFPQDDLGRAQGERSSMRGAVGAAYRFPLGPAACRAGPLGLARMVPHRADHPSLGPLRRGEAWARGFTGPVALVWGERDPILGRALRRHSEALPAAPVTRTAAGHFLQEEVPDALARAIEDVAARAGASP